MSTRTLSLALSFGLATAFVACGSSTRSSFEPLSDPAKAVPEGPAGGSFNGEAGPPPEAAAPLDPCINDHAAPAGPEVMVAPQYQKDYRIFELGKVPGVPGPLGGTVISKDDPDVLLIAGASERDEGGIFSIRVLRGPCKHIIGFDGTATKIASTPQIDANLVYTASGLLLYTRWPSHGFAQLPPGATQPALDTDLRAFNMGGGGAGGLGFVPPGLAAAGELRAVTWPDGWFYHLVVNASGSLLAVTDAIKTVTLPGGPGGFAYVPGGSPGFPKQRLIVAEWDANRVGTYEVDASGDPVIATRLDFLSLFPKPWGAYFEPLTGDFLFLNWGANDKGGSGIGDDDRIYVVQGFSAPPPPPTPKAPQ